VSASARLTPVSQETFFAPTSGVVDAVRVQVGDSVEAGQVLFTWDASDLDVRLFKALERLETARAPLRAAAGRTPAGRTFWNRLQQAEQDLARARPALWALVGDAWGAAPDEALIEAQVRVQEADARVEQARNALDVLSDQESAEAMVARAIEFELAALLQQRAQLEVPAPSTGVVTRLNVMPGRSVVQQQTVAQIDDSSRLKVVAVTTAQQAASIAPGERATLRFGPVRAPAVVEAVSGYELGFEIDNPNGALKAGSAPLDIELSARSIFDRLRR
jgi:HlyD family secretion protein